MKNRILYNSSQFLISFSLFIGLGTTRIINSARSDIWISIILGTIIGLIVNYLIKKLPDKNSKLLYYFFNIALLFLSIFVITKLISSVYLDKTNVIIIMLPFIGLLLYTSTKNRYALMKVISLLNIIYLLIIVFAICSLMPTIDLDIFRPVMINSPQNILTGAFEFALYSTISLQVLPKFKENYSLRIYFLSSILLLIIFIMIVGNLGVGLASLYRYPEYMIFKNIAILNFIENIQNVLFFIWIINIYTLSSHSIINIKEMFNETVCIGTIGALFIVMILTINNYSVTVFILDYLDWIMITLLIIYLLGKIKSHTDV